MKNPLRERSEQVELRTKLKSDIGSEHATGYPQGPSFVGHPVDAGRGAVESAFASAEPLGKPATLSSGGSQAANLRPDVAGTAQLYPAHVLHPRLPHGQLRANAKKTLHVMKFGGTSVADASCIAKVVEIVRAAAHESDVVVVVSAMSGVTNKLVEAANHSAAGNHEVVARIFEELRQRHETAANALIRAVELRQPVVLKMRQHLQKGEHLCMQTPATPELTPRLRDAISGLGERLSAPLVAAALAERGVTSEAIDATELVVTDSHHGSAEPFMDLTRERCEARLRPLLMHGVVAVVTGFIGATVDGVPTTLGRNSSDFSGTIMGAALDADQVTLWTDVDGILTADPKLVPGAYSIREMSYREASDLADLGAKVLHPKTLHALMQRGIPLAIRNTFAPERPGTKISLNGSANATEVKALTATNDAGLITVRGADASGASDLLRRTVATAAAVGADVSLAPQLLSSPESISIVVSSAVADRTVEALHREFEEDLKRNAVQRITLDPAVAIITVVGENMHNMEDLVERMFGALGRENLTLLASAPGISRSTYSFVVAQRDMKAALVAVHRELELSGTM